MTGVIVHIRHVRAVKLCARGARDWWQHNGLDWTDFLENGIPAEALEATGDHHALKVVAKAREEAHGW